MKKYLLFCVLSLNCTLGFIACNHDDDQFQESIQSRILGRWMLTGFIGKDVSADSTFFVFTPDGRILLDSKPNSEQGGLLVDMDSDTKVVYKFYDGLPFYDANKQVFYSGQPSYNEVTDEFESLIRVYEQGKDSLGSSYDCIVGRQEMRFIYKVGPNVNSGIVHPRRYTFIRH